MGELQSMKQLLVITTVRVRLISLTWVVWLDQSIPNKSTHFLMVMLLQRPEVRAKRGKLTRKPLLKNSLQKKSKLEKQPKLPKLGLNLWLLNPLKPQHNQPAENLSQAWQCPNNPCPNPCPNPCLNPCPRQCHHLPQLPPLNKWCPNLKRRVLLMRKLNKQVQSANNKL